MIGSAIGRPLSRPISHPNTGGSPQPQPRDSGAIVSKTPLKQGAKQKRDRGRDSQPRPRPRLNSQPQGATEIGCIVKCEAQTSPPFWQFSGEGGDFVRCACSMLIRLALPQCLSLRGTNSQTMVRAKLRSKLRRPQTLYLPGEMRNLDHSLTFWGGKTQTMV